MSHRWPRISSVCLCQILVLSSFMIFTVFLTWITRLVSLIEQELFTLPGHLSSPLLLSDSCFLNLSLRRCFVDRCFSLRLCFLLTIVLSFNLRFTVSDYPFLIPSHFYLFRVVLCLVFLFVRVLMDCILLFIWYKHIKSKLKLYNDYIVLLSDLQLGLWWYRITKGSRFKVLFFMAHKHQILRGVVVVIVW